MKKSFSLQTMELAEAAVKDAENFGLTASIEKNGEEISIAYDSPAMVTDKPEQYMTMAEVYSMMKNYSSEHEYQMKYMREDLAYMRQSFSKHVNEGHLPSISDAGMMKKALKSLGLEDSYEVKTPTIFVQY